MCKEYWDLGVLDASHGVVVPFALGFSVVVYCMHWR